MGIGHWDRSLKGQRKKNPEGWRHVDFWTRCGKGREWFWTENRWTLETFFWLLQMSVQAMTSCPWKVRHHEYPRLSSPITLRQLPVLAFQEELPQAFSSGHQSQGRGYTSWQARVKGSSGNTWSDGCFSGSPFKIVELSAWIRNESECCKQRGLLLITNRTGVI